jgi:mono/diheme cytochrome c family protein
MGKLLRWLGIILGGLVGLVLVVVLVIFVVSNGKLSQVYTIPEEPIAASPDASTVGRGEYLATINGCNECHGMDLAGTRFLEDPAFGYLPAPNLTLGGVGATYSDTDYANAIRLGVRPDGTSLLIMPSEHYYYLNDPDTAAIIAYLKSVPPVTNDLGNPSPGPILRMLLATGQFPLQAEVVAQRVNDAPRPAQVPVGATVEHGGYMANQCIGCHGLDLKGGVAQGDGGTEIPTPDITSAGAMARYTQEEFITAMRTGVRPDGSQISPAMPWQAFGQATDEDLIAFYLYLSQLPPEGRTAPGQ